MAIFRLGLQFSNISYPSPSPAAMVAQILEVARSAECNGFDVIWVCDHALQNNAGGKGPIEPMLEAYTLLGALGVATERAHIGALVSPVTFRSPSLLAKTVTTVDAISGGRAVLGIGAGWDAIEHTAYGIELPPIKERQDRLEEAVQIIAAMLREDAPSFSGTYYSIEKALNVPRPMQDPIPIMIAGGGERRTLRTVAKYADSCNFFGDPETIQHKLDVLARHCDDVGRDISEITTSASFNASGDIAEMKASLDARRRIVDAVFIHATECPDAETVARWGQALA